MNPPQLHWPLSRWESLAYLAIVIASGFIMPWWALMWPAAILGLTYGYRRQRIVRAAACLGGMSWFLVAIVRDLETGSRISNKVSAVMQMPHPMFLYIATFLLAAVLSALMAQLGRLIRELIETQLRQKPSGK